MASLDDSHFNAQAMRFSLLSVAASAVRAVSVKKSQGSAWVTSALANYATMTFVAAHFACGLAVVLELPRLRTAWNVAMSKCRLSPFVFGDIQALKPFLRSFPADAVCSWHIVYRVFASGFWFHLYNVAAFAVLGRMSVVSHSICNASRRTCVVLAALAAFGAPVGWPGLAGTIIALLGTFSYVWASRPVAAEPKPLETLQ
eukprot:Polyplicarium_translucidae@DN3307_c0_g1_i12.p1